MRLITLLAVQAAALFSLFKVSCLLSVKLLMDFLPSGLVEHETPFDPDCEMWFDHL